jgi:hypothetical protein
MEIKRIIVDQVPKSCAACTLLEVYGDSAKCFGVNENRYLTGNPFEMTYRRSDCLLVADEKTNVCFDTTATNPISQLAEEFW